MGKVDKRKAYVILLLASELVWIFSGMVSLCIFWFSGINWAGIYSVNFNSFLGLLMCSVICWNLFWRAACDCWWYFGFKRLSFCVSAKLLYGPTVLLEGIGDIRQAFKFSFGCAGSNFYCCSIPNMTLLRFKWDFRYNGRSIFELRTMMNPAAPFGRSTGNQRRLIA
ncbi:hypothetical protein KFK09_028160 [Dendrobium nobile]|uniref:Uncharacterized protein n=1 Tax=Dendrobium nobile TaxID=94219 RepID=A0A8T3A2F1_DENNO|nr:hypothetical protein KFK09_028160 [Dendrobium nobile]